MKLVYTTCLSDVALSYKIIDGRCFVIITRNEKFIARFDICDMWDFVVNVLMDIKTESPSETRRKVQAYIANNLGAACTHLKLE